MANISFNPNAYLEGIKVQVDRSSLQMSDWMVRNFKHPKNDKLPWSFEDHEFQIEIADCGDDVQTVVVKKCAQIGLSTLQINLVLAFCAMHDFHKCCYTLPTAKFATEFSAMRMNPAILASPTISGLISSETDNTGTKKIGTSFLVMRGTSGEAQAISVDLDMLVVDELDYCNAKVLSSFSSRLQHSLLKLRRLFSTPTLPNFGISLAYDQSSQALRAVLCNHCNHWVMPSFFNDLVIPGFDRPISMFRAPDADHPGVKDAYLSCPNCKLELTVETLNDPSRREWVHAFPDKDTKGYAVKFWDVPKYNPVPEVLTSLKQYTYPDWMNFRLGEEYESSENSFVLETVKRNAILRPINLHDLLQGSARNVFIGADLGKTNHYMVGVHNSDTGTLDVVHVGTIDVEQLMARYGEANMGLFVKELALTCWAIKTIVDHAPDYQTALLLHSQLPAGKAYGAYYVSAQKGKLDIYDFKDTQGAVHIDRDAHFDDVVSAVNSGKVRFPYFDTPEMGAVARHMSVIKKVKEINAKGISVETWTSTSSEDHYAHALGYLWCAYASVEERFGTSPLVLPPMPSRVRMK